MAATQKKTPSKGTKKKTKAPPPKRIHATARLVGGLVCLLLALCVVAGMFPTEAKVLLWLGDLCKGLLGWGYFLCGAMLLTTGIILICHRGRPVRLRVTCGLLTPLLCGVLAQVILCREAYTLGLPALKLLWADGKALRCGGVLAGYIGCVGETYLGTAVMIILCLLLQIAALFGICYITPAKAWERFRQWRESRYDEDEEYEDYNSESREETVPKHTSHRRTSIHIPLEGEQPIESAETVLERKRGGFFKAKDESIRTPAEALNGEEPSAQTPSPETVFAPPAAPTPVDEMRTHGKNAVTAQEVATATREVTDAIEKELSEEEGDYCYPPITLLKQNLHSNDAQAGLEQRSNSQRLADALTSFGVNAASGEVIHGPSVTRYEFTLDQGVKLSKITNLSDDIALSLGASSVRIAPVPGKISAVGIEVPNKVVTPVNIREVLESRAFVEHSSTTAFALGKDIGGSCVIGNISKLPHVLIAGTTGSGKSVCTNSLIVSLLYKSSPREVRFIMVDPKMVELAPYNGIPHLLIPVVTDPKKAAGALQWAVFEMMKRYKIFSEKGVKDLSGYNALCDNPMTAEEGMEHMPSVVVVIDELADLMLVAAKEVEESICRVAQMGRAAGVHLVIATQRPSADVITGLMKANIPSRIAFAVASGMESRIILDTTGAEKLVGKGDMLYFPLGDSKPTRLQGCFIGPDEIEKVVAFVKETGEAQYDQTVIDKIEEALKKDDKNANTTANSGESNDRDELFDAAVEVVLETQQASVSMLQRRLKLGYSRAARLVDQMEEYGIVGPFEGSKPRQLLITRQQWQELQMKQSAAAEPPAEAPKHDRFGSIRDVFESHDALD